MSASHGAEHSIALHASVGQARACITTRHLSSVRRLRVYDLPVDALEAPSTAADGDAAALAAAVDTITPPLRIRVRPHFILSQPLHEARLHSLQFSACRKGSWCMTSPGSRGWRPRTLSPAASPPPPGCGSLSSTWLRVPAASRFAPASFTADDSKTSWGGNTAFRMLEVCELSAGPPGAPVGRGHRRATVLVPGLRRQGRGHRGVQRGVQHRWLAGARLCARNRLHGIGCLLEGRRKTQSLDTASIIWLLSYDIPAIASQ